MPSTTDHNETVDGGLNLAVLRGPCSGPPEVHSLPSGRRLASLAVRVREPDDAKSTSVPVTVWEPPAWVETLAGGEPLVIVGRVRRRFFRTSIGGTGARVDVECDAIAKAGDRRRLDALRRRAETTLDRLAG